MRGRGKVVRVQWRGLSQVAVMETRKRECTVAGKEPTRSKTWKNKKLRMFWFLA